MSDTDKVTIHIKAAQRVFYSQYVEMTRAQWEELAAESAERMEDCDGPLAYWLDLKQVLHADDFDDVSMTLCDAEGNPIQKV